MTVQAGVGPVDTPQIYATRIHHARTSPLRNTFTYSSHSWLVDLDDLPRLPWWLSPLAAFRPEDHIGRPDRSIRANIDALLQAHGITLTEGRVLMLTNPRVLGYVFNPITVHWCFQRERLRCVVVEVHNTYGDRHAYVVEPDQDGRAVVDKAMYVSPFNDVSGSYRLRVPPPGPEVRVEVILERDGHPPFVATLRGDARHRGPAGRSAVLRTALRHPIEPLRVMARIRWQGIRLWARGLPVLPRPTHHVNRGVS